MAEPVTEERWTEQTEADLTGIAETFILDRGFYTPEDSIEGIAAEVVRGVLSALADAGLLVAPGGHTREEFGVGDPSKRVYPVKRHPSPSHVRTVVSWAAEGPNDDWPKYIGPWREVSP